MGREPEVHIHTHVHNYSDNPQTNEKLERIEAHLSVLTDAVARVGAAFAAQTDLLNRALENDAADAAANDALRAERDALTADSQQAIADLANIAPAPDEAPVVPEDVPVEPAP